MGNRVKLKDVEIIPDDLNSILDMSIKSIKLNRKCKFENTKEGLEDFKEASIAYLEYVKKTNNDPENEHHLIPDIESWATYLGTTRKTINDYERNRENDWKEFIAQMKNIVTACKKQLAFRQKIPTVLAMFDLTNNSDYVNSNQFTLKPETEESEKPLTAQELPRLGVFRKDNDLLPKFDNEDAPDNT